MGLEEELIDRSRKVPVDKRPWLFGRRGWLTNEGRRNRRDQVRTLSDEDVKQLIERIASNRLQDKDGSLKLRIKLLPPWDEILILRDKCLVSLGWCFIKRGSEILNVRVGDVTVTDKELLVNFTILKKTRRSKTCPQCNKDSYKKAMTCKYCHQDLSKVEATRAKPPKVTKRKTLQYPFTTFVVEWMNKLKELNTDPLSYVFPRYSIRSKTILFDEHITIQRFGQVLQQLDNSLFTAIFRYGCAEKYLDLGYTPSELKEIGDWSSSYMPELYAKRKGQTRTQRRFAEDVTKW